MTEVLVPLKLIYTQSSRQSPIANLNFDGFQATIVEIDGEIALSLALTDVARVLDADAPITSNGGIIWRALRGLTADRTITLPAAPSAGMQVVVRDEDGSLGTPHNIIVDGGTQHIFLGAADEGTTFTMTAANTGPGGSLRLFYDGIAWRDFS